MPTWHSAVDKSSDVQVSQYGSYAQPQASGGYSAQGASNYGAMRPHCQLLACRQHLCVYTAAWVVISLYPVLLGCTAVSLSLSPSLHRSMWSLLTDTGTRLTTCGVFTGYGQQQQQQQQQQQPQTSYAASQASYATSQPTASAAPYSAQNQMPAQQQPATGYANQAGAYGVPAAGGYATGQQVRPASI